MHRNATLICSTLAVKTGSTLNHVILGEKVVMANGVMLGDGVQMANSQPIEMIIKE